MARPGGCPGPARRIVEFRAREIAAVANSSCDEHLAVGQQRRGCDLRGTGGCQWPFRSRSTDRTVPRSRESRRLLEPLATSTPAAGQQRRSVLIAWVARLPVASRSRSPDRTTPPARYTLLPKSSRDEHLAVGQQRRRVFIACGAEGLLPQNPLAGSHSSGNRENAAAAKSSSDEHLAVEQHRCRVILACGAEVAGGRPAPARRIV